jgi:acetyltransferase-like isoleucine patch superfamily enzyme
MQSQKQDVREDGRAPDNRQGSAATPVRNVQPISAGHSGPADRRNAVQHKPFMRRALNRVLHLLCRFLPGATTLRPFLHRKRGMQIGNNVWIGDDAYLENEFPEQVEIHDGAVVGLRAIVIAHTRGTGRIIIGKDVYIGAGAVIVTVANRTLVIGEGSVIMASSLVTGSVAPYTLYGSDASKPLARITKPFTASTTYEEFMTTLRPLSD